MVNEGRMLSGGHWWTSWRSGPKWSGRKERGPMSPPGQPLRIQRRLDLLDNCDPLDHRDPQDSREPGLLTLSFTLPWAILLPRPIPPLGIASSVPSSGLPSTGLPASGLPSSGLPCSGLPSCGLPSPGVPCSALPSSGLPYSGLPYSGVPWSGLPSSGLPYFGLPYSGLPYSSLPYSGLPYSGLPYSGLPYSGLPSTHGRQPGWIVWCRVAGCGWSNPNGKMGGTKSADQAPPSNVCHQLWQILQWWPGYSLDSAFPVVTWDYSRATVAQSESIGPAWC